MNRAILKSVCLLALVTLGACSGYQRSAGGPTASPRQLQREAEAVVHAFRQHDPTLAGFFDSTLAYAVFPVVGKGGFGVGMAYGEGVLYEGGEPVGYAALTQSTVGAQLGGQSYSQIIFFEDTAALDRFKGGEYDFSAQASVVAAHTGAAANAGYRRGVAVFTHPRGGIMFEGSIGGQRFAYRPGPEGVAGRSETAGGEGDTAARGTSDADPAAPARTDDQTPSQPRPAVTPLSPALRAER